jgi:hypothetical protein
LIAQLGPQNPEERPFFLFFFVISQEDEKEEGAVALSFFL